MIIRRNPSFTRHFEPAAYLAILVIAIILISIAHPDPIAVKALTDLTVAYVVGRYAVRRRHEDGHHESHR
ncbi:hypothetical protein DMB66_53625 [Actinoplanes sp. ATCC 53533]|uniref:hypothetical protein n=1 Tax=Actinoplanes sp. ATCC 53533 TaxID=1288362 RepID=UPI000F771C9B|nr:hypothetical protein [Actinoplanes sp. ATCC 53533]RSM43269.1 hypothetical protein DMB66_53625 [Actinoplanes sp. ATCC 53533]